MDERNWDKLDQLIDALGAEKVCEELGRWLDTYTFNQALDDIINDYGI